MLFTWDTENLCIVFRQWHVRSTATLLTSLVIVVLLGVGYEALRAASRRYELTLAKQIESIPRKYSSAPALSFPPSPRGFGETHAGLVFPLIRICDGTISAKASAIHSRPQSQCKYYFWIRY